MRIRQRTTIAVIGLLTSFLMAGVTLAPAHATPADHPGNDKITVTRGPHGAAVIQLPSQTSPASIAAAAPTTSPAVQRDWIPNGSTYECDRGYACATVKYGAGYYVFRFYYYGTYALSNWYGDGYVLNNQTGGAAVRVLDVHGGQLLCESRSPWSRYVVWDPAWYIRLTSSSC